MKVIIAAPEKEQEAWKQSLPQIPDIIFCETIAWPETPAADLFIITTAATTTLQHIQAPILLADITGTAPANFLPQQQVAIFCGWNSFIQRETWDMALLHEGDATWLHNVMNRLGKKVQLTANIPGLVAPRIVSAIINEAYYTLADGVSTKTEIDTAMKLGTNYPFGPFEWSATIGLQFIYELLFILSQADERCTPAPLLVQEALDAQKI